MEQAQGTSQPRGHAGLIGWVVLVLLLGIAAGGLWARGASFYVLDIGERVDHPDYRVLSPGYIIGHGYGIVGSGLIVANLAYLVRRRLAKWRLGSMRAWLNLHSATGLFAGLFVVFHSAFQVRTPLATGTMSAVVILILSGIVGRFIFAFVPTPEVERLEAHLKRFDQIGNGRGRLFRERLDAIPKTVVPGRVTLLKTLWYWRRWRRESRLRRDTVLETALELQLVAESEIKLLNHHIQDAAEVAGQVPRAAAANAFMSSWRGLHRFTALLALLLVGVHVAVAWYYGYRWIFSDDPTLAL